MTRTYAVLDVSKETHKEIRDKLRNAGYDHAIDDNGDLDMHGIVLHTTYAPRGTPDRSSADLEKKLNQFVHDYMKANPNSRVEIEVFEEIRMSGKHPVPSIKLTFWKSEGRDVRMPGTREGT